MIQKTGGLDAVDQGPLASDAPVSRAPVPSAEPSHHPSVVPLVTRFGEAIR